MATLIRNGATLTNPFGREAMKQGARSAVEVKKGETLRLVYAALVHDGRDFEPIREHRSFQTSLKE